MDIFHFQEGRTQLLQGVDHMDHVKVPQAKTGNAQPKRSQRDGRVADLILRPRVTAYESDRGQRSPTNCMATAQRLRHSGTPLRWLPGVHTVTTLMPNPG